MARATMQNFLKIRPFSKSILSHLKNFFVRFEMTKHHPLGQLLIAQRFFSEKSVFGLGWLPC